MIRTGHRFANRVTVTVTARGLSVTDPLRDDVTCDCDNDMHLIEGSARNGTRYYRI
jgi:hypothetical protein